MNIFLSKLLPLFVYPTGLVTLFLVLTLLFWKNRNVAKTALIIALVLILAAGNKFVSYSLAKTLEWQYPPLASNATADVIVVLGGATEPNIHPRQMVEVNSAADRILYAAKLYKEGAAPKLLLSGGDVEFLDQSSGTPATDMASLFELIGIPVEDLLIQSGSQNTYEDALYSCPMIKEQGFQKVILVTSAMHMPRSVALFESQGCTVIPAPTDYTITETAWERLTHPNPEEFFLNLMPTYTSLSLVTKTMKEYIGMFYYQLTGIL